MIVLEIQENWDYNTYYIIFDSKEDLEKYIKDRIFDNNEIIDDNNHALDINSVYILIDDYYEYNHLQTAYYESYKIIDMDDNETRQQFKKHFKKINFRYTINVLLPEDYDKYDYECDETDTDQSDQSDQSDQCDSNDDYVSSD